MTDEHSNLRLLRGPSVWQRAGWNGHRDDIAWRATLAGLGVALLAVALRRGRWAAPAALVGTALVGCAVEPRAWDTAVTWLERRRGRRDDLVDDESAASFPASDSPSWSSTTGSVGNRAARSR